MKTAHEECVLKSASLVGNGGLMPQGDSGKFGKICFRMTPPEGKRAGVCMDIPTPGVTDRGLLWYELATGVPCSPTELPFTV